MRGVNVLKAWCWVECGCDLGWFIDVTVVLGVCVIVVVLLVGGVCCEWCLCFGCLACRLEVCYWVESILWP